MSNLRRDVCNTQNEVGYCDKTRLGAGFLNLRWCDAPDTTSNSQAGTPTLPRDRDAYATPDWTPGTKCHFTT
ncbi:MAG: hypothetical protein HQ568_03635 [Calditrichaeota bacterium]|nr:hypothetical protein [Calditrichota bacterium]